MFTFKKYNRNQTSSKRLETPVITAIDTGHIIYFDGNVPTLVDVDTAIGNEGYILAEKLVPANEDPTKEGHKDKAVYFPIKDSDLITAKYVYLTATEEDEPEEGLDVAVEDGVRVVKPGVGEVARFTVYEVRDSIVKGTNTEVTVTLKKI